MSQANAVIESAGPREGKVEANGLTLHYEERGRPDGEPLVLVMGLGAQMTLWPEPLLDRYVAAGFRVIRFDNRDIGLSSEIRERLEGPPPVAMLRYKLGWSVLAPYRLEDMADDLGALMTALGVESAHLVGASMGGMISQIFAAREPQRVRSLTLIMTSTNSPRLPMPHPRVIWGLNGGGIKGHHEDAAVARGVAFWRTIQSPAYPRDEDELAQRIRNDYRRSYRPAGILRQMRAIMATGSLEDYSRRIEVPTRILHGTADPLVKPPAARQLRKLIRHSEVCWFRGMGHDLPEALFDPIVEQTLQVSQRINQTGH
ncbi:alpha/beta hydrolase [Marinobacteraceae bacterium S3BR75-40.1]